MAIRLVKRNMDSKSGRLLETTDVKSLFFDLIKIERIVMFAQLDKTLTRNAS